MTKDQPTKPKRQIYPTEDRVFVRRDDPETKTASGIILLPDPREQPSKGTVVAVGPGTKASPTKLREGDAVLFNKYSGRDMDLGDDTLVCLREPEVYAKSIGDGDVAPLGARVLVLYDRAAEFVANGLLIVPEAYRKQPLKGTVVAVGPGTKDDPMVLEIGDRVEFDWKVGTQVMHAGQAHLCVFQDDILCVIEDSQEKGAK